jgi:hypothetical protein
MRAGNSRSAWEKNGLRQGRQGSARVLRKHDSLPTIGPTGATLHRSVPLAASLASGTTATDADLRRRALLLCQGIINAHDQSSDFLPFFYIDVRGGRLSFQHSSWSLDDSTFRNVSALARVYQMTGEQKLLLFLDPMIRNVDRSLAIGDGINADGDRALMHNMSRGLLALSAMAQVGDRELWLGKLNRFLDRLLAIYRLDGWETGQEYMLASGTWRGHEPAPAASGRTIGGLVRCYRVAQDDRALELAERLVRANLACFADDGQLLESAGQHFHSIADTVQGMLAYAQLLGDRALTETCERIYRVGLKAHGIDATGWFAEHVHWPGCCDSRTDGEICCTANMISCALLLGRAGYTHAFEDAERYIRNMLFASQLLDLSSVNIDPSDEPRWPEFQRRLIGNVAGFPSSTGAYDPTSPHLTQLCCPAQAAEALCDAWEAGAVATRPSGSRAGDSQSIDEVSVNLLFSMENEHVIVTSDLPARGHVSILARRDLHLRIKAPPGHTAGPDAPIISRAGIEPIAAPLRAGYFHLGLCRAGTMVQVRFDLPRNESVEGCTLQPWVRMHWLGNTIIDCDTHPDLLPLYTGRASLGDAPIDPPARKFKRAG